MNRLQIPALRKHLASGRAVVTVPLNDGSRRDFYCGPYGSAEARDEYKRIVEVLVANDGRYPTHEKDITVAEVLRAYLKHLEQSSGERQSGLYIAKKSIKSIRTLFGNEPARAFGPKALKIVQQKWVSQEIPRTSANALLSSVKRAWKWLVSEEMVTAENYAALQSVEGLRKGKTVAPERPPVLPANETDFEKVLPFLPPIVAAVVKLQAITGARCGELVKLKAADIDRTAPVWTFSPMEHKGAWRGKGRTIFFGPAAQAILTPLIDEAGDDYLFSPRRSEDQRRAVNHEKRRTPRYPSHMARNERKRLKDPKRSAGDVYNTAGIRLALERACRAAKVKKITPPQTPPYGGAANS